MLTETFRALEAPGLRERSDNFLRDLYADLDAKIGTVQSTCRSCTRCCDFSYSGLNLYATNLELAFFIRNVPPPSGPIIGRCPFLDDHAGCTVRAVRPIGCRTYFCAPSTGYDPQDLYEGALAKVKQFIREHDLPYLYAEWLTALGHHFER